MLQHSITLHALVAQDQAGRWLRRCGINAWVLQPKLECMLRILQKDLKY